MKAFTLRSKSMQSFHLCLTKHIDRQYEKFDTKNVYITDRNGTYLVSFGGKYIIE